MRFVQHTGFGTFRTNENLTDIQKRFKLTREEAVLIISTNNTNYTNY